MEGCGLESSISEHWSVDGCCERGNEPSNSINAGNFSISLLKKDSAPCSLYFLLSEISIFLGTPDQGVKFGRI
jgi:hypothetical protein